MIKQWKNNNLDVVYFHLPNSENDEILTSDGVLIPFAEFKKMTSERYNSEKNTHGGYDYNLSRQNEKLVKKVMELKPTETKKQSNKVENKSEVKQNSDLPKTNVKTVKKSVKTINPIIKQSVVSPQIISEKPTENKIEQSINNEIKLNEDKPSEQKTNEIEKQPFNLFDWVYPKIMIFITIICSTLSVYFTATYLQRLQNVALSYAISLSMLLYGLIGFQIARRKSKEKKNKQSFIYYLTSIIVILFSMLSSLDVNYSKYKMHHATEEIAYNTNDGLRENYILLQQEYQDNKKEIESLEEDIKVQQTQYVMTWDNDLKKNVIIDGKITSVAQEKIKEDNIEKRKYVERNAEIKKQMMEYNNSGISMNKEEGKLEKSKSLTDLLGMILGLSGDLIQLIFLLVPSIFIDIIGVLSLSIFTDRFEEKKNK